MTNASQQIGIVGAGTMGGGIAMAFANAGFPVTIVDSNDAALERCIERTSGLYAEGVKRGKLTEGEMTERLARIATSSHLSSLAASDLIIEAVFEDLALKSRIAGELGQICTAGTILASNTSSLDVNHLARASGRPVRYVGMHFFSPAHIMRLVEVIRGDESSTAAVESVVAIVKALGKVPVVSGVCFGFIGNRIAEPYLREAEAMVLEGASPAQIDAVAQSAEWGMAMGPCRMMDLAGLDVGASIIAERAAATNLLDDASYRGVVRALTDQGNLGQKTGRGFYRYEGRQPVDAPETIELARDLARKYGIVQRDKINDDEIFQRLFYPLVNEGFEVLREGIAESSADIDTVFTAGYGFPAARGGPMAMAESIGLDNVRRGLIELADKRGNQFGYWTVSPLLAERSRTHEVTP